jgi:hypothetical protein
VLSAGIQHLWLLVDLSLFELKMSVIGDCLRCLRCKSLKVEPTGFDATIFVCPSCGQHYRMLMQMIPVDSPKLALEADLVGSSEGASRGCLLPEKGS